MRTLFSGSHGTGKTLASEVVAARLDVDLHSAALDALVSKYIGETEKNLRRVFLGPKRSTSSFFWMKLTPSWARGRRRAGG
jgi:SpoVK/Ycf46/Vps4 family AAA+-type ATPase